MAPEIRTLTSPGELPEWQRALSTGFLRGPEVSEGKAAQHAKKIELARTQGAYDGGRCVATFRTTPQRLTVPGGAALDTCAVTNVTVTATHRRRGLLSRMMGGALRSAKERGDACSTLIAAEYPIYGRYGYGPATWSTEWEADVARSGLDPRYGGPPDGGRVDIIDAEEVRRTGPALYERFRTQPHRQGTIDRDDHWWQANTGARRFPGDDYPDPFFVLHRDAAGRPQGLAAFSVRDRWEGKVPDDTAQVHHLTALTPQAESALWRFVFSVDWVTGVRTGLRAPDDVLPLLLPDPRAARVVAHADFLWVRPLDVPRMLIARTYQAPGTLVLEVRDEAGLAGGRFRLETGPGGAHCAVTGEEPELVLDVGELGALYLGDESAVRLVSLGRVEERREGAAAAADALLRTPRRAWCPDIF
jgi:predicted acetyltransferase